MNDVPFEARFGVLLALLALGAGVDVARRGRAATRPREYATLLAAGLIGAVFALGVDQVTSRLSPEYFVIGKELPAGPGFARAVVVLSLQAGLVAGLVLGGVLLVANQRPALPAGRLLGRALWPMGGALLCAPLGMLVATVLDPLGMRADLGKFLTPVALEDMVRVWGIHAGLYAGALLGTIVAVFEVRRRSATAEDPGRERL